MKARRNLHTLSLIPTPHDVIGTSLLCLPTTLGRTLWNVTKWFFLPLNCQSCGRSYVRGMTTTWYFYMYTPECDHALVCHIFLLYRPFLSFSVSCMCVCEYIRVRVRDDQTTLWEHVLTFHLSLEGPLLPALRRSKPAAKEDHLRPSAPRALRKNISDFVFVVVVVSCPCPPPRGSHTS